MKLSALPLFGLALLSSSVGAEVLVVDAANGPGTDFTTLAGAVAGAAEGDVLLVRSGSYGQSLFIDGKSLVLQAEAGATVLASVGVTVRNLAPAQAVVVRGIDMQAPQLTGALLVENCQGTVWIEDAELLGSSFFAFPGGGVRVSGSASVVLSRCVVQSFEHQFLDPGLAVLSSTVTLLGSTVHGVKGFDQAAGTPNPGGAGVHVSQGELIAGDSTIIGGAGGDFVGFPACRNGGAGGTGMELRAGSTVQLFGTAVLGGPGGGTFGACSQGPTGPATRLDETSVLTSDPTGLGVMSQTGPVRAGNPFTVDVTAEPGAFAWSAYGAAPTAGVVSPNFLGALHVPLAPLLLEPLGFVPASGSLQLGFGTTGFLPPGAEALVLVSQLVTFSPSDGRVRVGGATALTVLDPSF